MAVCMVTKAINVTIDANLLAKSEALVADGKYFNRSQFIQEVVAYLLKKIDADLICEQAKLLSFSSERESEEWFDGELDSWQEKY
jgi:Arc/MetJ-type ribon-helix-helix transcriptional regulator